MLLIDCFVAMEHLVVSHNSTHGRNHIEDVKTMMESQHCGHYTVYNLSERTYSASRFPSGQVVHTPLRQDAAPSLDTLLDLCSAILDYLSRNSQRAIACGLDTFHHFNR